MTRRIDWRDGATAAEQRRVKHFGIAIKVHRDEATALSADRKRLIARCYQKAARAAKRGK